MLRGLSQHPSQYFRGFIDRQSARGVTSDQRTFGGAVTGDLIAASPVEVIVCSFAAPAAPMNPKFVVPSRGMHSGLPSELSGHPKGKRSGNRKR
ncbi:hypothetical protein MTR67_050319 [Solanum verrucosum]|uniref:Uncharacterized protein n=1 Tax=Solanum verrucosum TaxID=315347 RepID=A0AAF0V4A0_SOLVR|nr:hypothetical protein MTR67_050319 [Solanum verrucosum]